VTNDEATQQGRDRYTQDELIELYLLAVSSRQLSVATGNSFYVKDKFPAVLDINEEFGTSDLITRSGSDAGAVDAFIIGEDLQTVTEIHSFQGIGRKIALATSPIVRVDSVTSGSNTYVEGDDYELALDATGVSGSVRATDGIRFLASATSPPALGDSVSILYAYNQLVRDLQEDAEDPEVQVEGRDLLYRLGGRVDIILTARLRVKTGFVASTVQTNVETALLAYFPLKLRQPVEESDLQKVVRQLSGVDNFVVTRLVSDSSDIGVSDIELTGNKYAALDPANLTITLF